MLEFESSGQLAALPDLAAERGYDTSFLESLEPDDALLDPWVPIDHFAKVGGVSRASVERAAVTLAESLLPPDPTQPDGETVLGTMLDDLARSQPALHDHFINHFEAMMELANEVARAQCLQSVVWVVTEGPLAPFGWTAVHRVLDRDDDPIAARLLASDDNDDGELQSLDLLPGDVMLAFALSGRCPDFNRRLEEATRAGISVGIIHPEGSHARHGGAIRLAVPSRSGRHLVAANLLVIRMIAAVARQLVGERQRRQNRESERLRAWPQ